MPIVITRRSFLLQSGLVAGGLLMPSCQGSAGSRPTLRFGVVTDSHYADREPLNTRHYRESLGKMKECIDRFNEEAVDFVVHLGDFKDEDKNANPEDTLRYLKALEHEFAKFQGPTYHCVGNHDVDSITKQQFLRNINNTGIAKDAAFYSFESKGFQFIVLDANFHEDGRDHYYKEGANWQDTRIPPAQLDWLKTTLAQTALPVIIFCHHPLYPFEQHGNVYHVQNQEAVREILAGSGKVQAVFQGHTHMDNYRQIDGIHYLTLLAMVDHSGPENNAYAIVEVHADQRMELIGYRRIANQSL